MASCVLLNSRSNRVSGIQLLLSFMLIARGTSKQAMNTMNHAGVCMSYSQTWRYLRQLTKEAHFLQMVQTGHWMWVYDNLNMHQKVRHERHDHHSSMLNITSRLAVDIRYLPPEGIDWNDHSPQRSRGTLTLDDVLLSGTEGETFHRRAVRFMMEFLVTHFKALSDLARFVPEEECPHPVQKTIVVPMKILFKDEKYIDETVDILTQLVHDAALTGGSQVIIGDQLTCKNIRGAKKLVQPEINPVKKLKWANESPGDFHFLWECLRVIYLIYWGRAGQTGSLCNLREVLRRTQVDKGVKVFSIGDEFILHCFSSHLTSSICTQLNLKTPSDPITHDTNKLWLEKTAENIVTNTIHKVSSPDTTYSFHRSFVRTAYHYIDLRNAIRHENGQHVVRHWKFWLPYFLGSGRTNYSVEAANLLCNLQADFPIGIAYIATHNRTVNTDGRPGHGKPIDQVIEHYNLVIKQALRSSGANVTTHHIEEVSLCGLFLMDAAKKADTQFGVHKCSTRHTTRESGNDITKMVTHILEDSICKEDLTRRETVGVVFNDPEVKGLQQIGTGWFENYIARSITLEEVAPMEETMDEEDFDYELYGY